MASTGTTRHILVVDDDEVMREVLSAIFEMDGHTVQTTASGAGALASLQQAEPPFDVVLADLQMPGLSGAELAALLNDARSPRTMLIGMSGSEPKERERVLFDAFLVKPFGLEAFMDAVQQGGAVRSGSEPEPRPIFAERTASLPALDEAVYARLAKVLPPAQLRELYEVATADVERRVLTMQAAVARDDFAECRREAHAIKGGCGMVGAVEISALASRIEASAFKDTPPLADFASACSRLKRILDARFTTPKH